MASFRIRPKFSVTSTLTTDEILSKVKNRLRDNTDYLHGQAMQDHITIRVNKEQRHYWSPQLSVLLQEDEASQSTLITGVYGPMPNVWTLFAISYLALSVMFTFISIIGFSQRALNQEAPILYALPIIVITAAVLYILSQMGQKLGAAQTYTIHFFFQEALGEKLPEI
ncbi:MAG TPA: hypothetical protein PK611_07745 [Saprospiraceae bacterium]|jgi:ABC-type Na+ efflux pump permease subunit|nr:hypothetical protein [Saprospiraceae bacterium]HRO08267.1 hypothetical protein [Saprospiraceae bacterium]HRO73547.1 hypothetical protein [Saprospiraceae bacterium]HRP41158.1 hypothetical protein [Saprospiraceae bacterium]